MRTDAGMFDVSHMGEIETRGPRRRGLPAAPAHQRRREDRARRRPVLAAVPRGRRRPRRPLHLPARTDDRYLTVVNASNADTDFDWFAEQAAGFDGVEVRDVADRLRDARAPGPAARASSSPALARRRAARRAFRHGRARSSRARRRSSAAPATRARTASSCCSTPRRRPAVWDALLDARARPRRASARATRCGSRSAYPLYGNDLDTERTPIEAGLGWACADDTGFIGVRAVCASRREQGTAEKLAPFVFTERGHPAPGLRRAARRRAASAR